ncbi:hypothetical protein ASPBRDRAFT_242580 [Aspergillus brasiliensis CBS 101740]|uniref:Uncharacterized protein n=1 Tax=Aspergillus brasiliensis (strain CBS 101740 / IMI 381727 / IBT 21946) TaxID=767769 RepID=A0A1L9V0Z7_ASPBC|nr:hypothetical protein ASPBRDRAFT_242580 [Aspergillus brasiliensis CBS 101740]
MDPLLIPSHPQVQQRIKKSTWLGHVHVPRQFPFYNPGSCVRFLFILSLLPHSPCYLTLGLFRAILYISSSGWNSTPIILSIYYIPIGCYPYYPLSYR